MTNLIEAARQGRTNALARLQGGNSRSRSTGTPAATFMSVRGQR